ncbi:uncharacterized protein LOC119178630 isoform X1 [Rhipicephalus microplus]|uniref:uncharacterized protein LOC119178630 isoform X1 n=1 Tax=Rhipicephalus microplus TaxID=6941 RepID=UPI003F6B0822
MAVESASKEAAVGPSLIFETRTDVLSCAEATTVISEELNAVLPGPSELCSRVLAPGQPSKELPIPTAMLLTPKTKRKGIMVNDAANEIDCHMLSYEECLHVKMCICPCMCK